MRIEVQDSLGNLMRTFYNEKDALDYKFVKGNPSWKLVWK